MNKVTLYPEQAGFISAIYKAMKDGHKHVAAVAPPAYGKSICIASIANDCANKGKKVLILTHRIKILTQNNGAMGLFGINPVVLNDTKKGELKESLVYSSSAQTLRSRILDEDVLSMVKSCDLILIDELHSEIYNFLLESGIIDNTLTIGFTGTCLRMGSNSRQIGLDYSIIVETTKKSELIESGRLPKCRCYEVPYNISNVKTDSGTGDYNNKSAYQAFDSPRLYGGILNGYKKHGENKPFVAFCCNIQHCVSLCLEFNKAGVKTKFVTSTVNRPKEPENKESGEYGRYLDRLDTYNAIQDNIELMSTPEDINDEFEAGNIQGVCSIDVLSTGWSYNPLAVCILAKCTKSKSLLYQYYGRVERKYEYKEYGIILDYGTNIERLGRPEDNIEHSLWHEISTQIGVVSLKQCGEKGVDKVGNKGCQRLILASYSRCPICNHLFATEKELRDVELIERLKDESTILGEMTPQALLDYAELHGNKKTWCFRRLWLQGDYKFKKGMAQIMEMSEEDQQAQFNRLGLDSPEEPKSIVDGIKRKLRAKCFKEGMKALGYNPKYYYPMLQRYER
jgi:superfamily II DNA or RNA helicase